MSLAVPRLTCPSFSLTKPFTHRTLGAIRAALRTAAVESDLEAHQQQIRQTDAESGAVHGKVIPDAAVLVPLCNVRGCPAVLFEVRGNLRTHAGEIRYVTLV